MLECRNIEKHYDGVRALKGVTFDVRAGEIHALCGENGAGKSTLSKIMAGVVVPDKGEIIWEGAASVVNSPAKARQMGIGIIFQELDLFTNLTIGENILLGQREAERFWVDRTSMDAFCRPHLRRVGLDMASNTLLGDLNIAARQLVSIARALSMRAKILLLDEPTSSLPEEAAERLLQLTMELKAAGAGIVYVSHKMNEIFRIADRVTVLRDGEHVATHDAKDTSIDKTIRLMVGRKINVSDRIKTRPNEEIALSVDSLKTSRLKNVSFSSKKGEVLGIAGLMGSGRTALGEALFGMDEWQAGQAEYEGKPFRPFSPRGAIRAHFVYLPEDRRTQGLFINTTVRHNASAAILPEVSSFGFLRFGKEKDVVGKELIRARVKVASDLQPVKTLSGGNQQKVLLAKWLVTQPHILYLDDPTRGVDVGAKADVYAIIEALSEAGRTVLIASSELLELLRITHRILVLHEGRSVGSIETARASQEGIMALATNRSAT